MLDSEINNMKHFNFTTVYTFSSCLRSWLEQDTSCPTCRQALNERPQTDPNGNETPGAHLPNNPAPPNAPGNQTTNHFFHFDGKIIFTMLVTYY